MAARPPFQLVAPTDGVSVAAARRSGRARTSGMDAAASWALLAAVRPEKTAITPCGRRARTCSVQALPGVRRPCISVSDDGRARAPGRPPRRRG